MPCVCAWGWGLSWAGGSHWRVGGGGGVGVVWWGMPALESRWGRLHTAPLGQGGGARPSGHPAKRGALTAFFTPGDCTSLPRRTCGDSCCTDIPPLISLGPKKLRASPSRPAARGWGERGVQARLGLLLACMQSRLQLEQRLPSHPRSSTLATGSGEFPGEFPTIYFTPVRCSHSHHRLPSSSSHPLPPYPSPLSSLLSTRNPPKSKKLVGGRWAEGKERALAIATVPLHPSAAAAGSRPTAWRPSCACLHSDYAIARLTERVRVVAAAAACGPVHSGTCAWQQQAADDVPWRPVSVSGPAGRARKRQRTEHDKQAVNTPWPLTTALMTSWWLYSIGTLFPPLFLPPAAPWMERGRSSLSRVEATWMRCMDGPGGALHPAGCQQGRSPPTGRPHTHLSCCLHELSVVLESGGGLHSL